MTVEAAKIKFPKGSIVLSTTFGKVMVSGDWKQAPGDKEPWANVLIGHIEGSLPVSKLS